VLGQVTVSLPLGQGVRGELVERKTPEVRPKQAEILWFDVPYMALCGC
jgi:hypothetical protein